MHQHCCPWWLNYLLDNPLRRLVHPPRKLLGRYLRPGMRVLDAGCGMGAFSLPMAEMAGEGGEVVAADIQPRNLEILMDRAGERGLADRITPLACDAGDLPVEGPFDFVLAFYSLHEVEDFPRMLRRVAATLAGDGAFLLIEPKVDVRSKDFSYELDEARKAGLEAMERPEIRFSHAALLVRDSGQATKM